MLCLCSVSCNKQTPVLNKELASGRIELLLEPFHDLPKIMFIIKALISETPMILKVGTILPKVKKRIQQQLQNFQKTPG